MSVPLMLCSPDKKKLLFLFLYSAKECLLILKDLNALFIYKIRLYYSFQFASLQYFETNLFPSHLDAVFMHVSLSKSTCGEMCVQFGYLTTRGGNSWSVLLAEFHPCTLEISLLLSGFTLIYTAAPHSTYMLPKNNIVCLQIRLFILSGSYLY